MSNNCDMPDCVGSHDTETKAVRDPSGTLMEMCVACMNNGWGAVVEVLD